MMTPLLPRSGNYLVDLYDQYLDSQIDREILDCGCIGYCKCDDGWDCRD